MTRARLPARRVLPHKLAVAAALLALAACSKTDPPPARDAAAAAAAGASATAAVQGAATAAAHPAPAGTEAAGADGGIAWRHASTDAAVDAAFAAGRAENKPVFVYWGAAWCPPCNQVKATLFNRQDFIERSRAFVPVYVDGDSPGAQKLGARFRVGGYPTMVLFSPAGAELTRLPGEVDPGRYSEVLTLGMNADRPVKAVLADALAGGRMLKPNDWRLLAFYSWDTDQQQTLADGALPATLARLADACPADQPETAMRLRLKALAAVDAKPARLSAAAAKPRAPVDAASRTALLSLLADPPRARAQTDVLTGYAAEIVRAASGPKTTERRSLLTAFDAALKRLEADTTLSRADRMQALVAQVDLARIDLPDDAEAAKRPAPKPTIPAALLADVREQAARADREITDGYERQAVITTAAYLLERAGLDGESDALLKASLAKSHSPYYLMSQLAGNAKRRGDRTEALRWYREAFERSVGPATRLQWGAGYLGALVELAPTGEATIEATASRLFAEAATQPDAFYERSGRSLKRIGAKLQSWNGDSRHGAAISRLTTRLQALCAGRGSEEQAACTGLLTAPAKPRA